VGGYETDGIFGLLSATTTWYTHSAEPGAAMTGSLFFFFSSPSLALLVAFSSFSVVPGRSQEKGQEVSSHQKATTTKHKHTGKNEEKM